MKELTLVKNEVPRTPIETALEIDEQGYTTAKKLYAWLELDESHYSRWVQANITENPFAEKGSDYSPLRASKIGRGQFAQDYRISAPFAKRLAMAAKSERGEQARIYFVMCEQMLVKLAKERERLLLERAKGIAVRKSLTDVIIASGENDRMKGHGCSVYTELIYKAALGKTTRQLRDNRGLDKRDNVRDNLTADELEQVRKVEDAISSLISLGHQYDDIKEFMLSKPSPLELTA